MNPLRALDCDNQVKILFDRPSIYVYITRKLVDTDRFLRYCIKDLKHQSSRIHPSQPTRLPETPKNIGFTADSSFPRKRFSSTYFLGIS